MVITHTVCGWWLLCCICICCFTQVSLTAADAMADDMTTEGVKHIKVFTVATEFTDEYFRYIRSAHANNIEVNTLSMYNERENGNKRRMGGCYKINLLREALKPYQNEKDTIVLFTNSYDVIFITGLKEIYRKFKGTGAKVLFSAEKYCWPDESLAEKYPQTSEPNASRFLNSGGFIGYAPQVYAILQGDIKDDEDDQLFFTHVFLREDLRSKYGIMLDTHSQLFQNLCGAEGDMLMTVCRDTKNFVVQNTKFMTQPNIVHGTGPGKIHLNSFDIHLYNIFSGEYRICEHNHLEFVKKSLLTITLTILVTQPVPFFDMFLQKIEKINYPKNKMHLFVYCNQLFHDEMVESFVKLLGDEYLSTKMISSADEINEQRGRELALMQAQSTSSDYMLVVKADAHIDEPELLRELLIANKQFVAPIFRIYDELKSSNQTSLSVDSYCRRPHDNDDAEEASCFDICNMPYVSTVYLIKNTAFKHIKYENNDDNLDMAVCNSLRSANIFIYVVSQSILGHLVNTKGFNSSVARPDFYTLLSNRPDWLKKYIRRGYLNDLIEGIKIAQPCPDVYLHPVVTEAFCDDLIAIMEKYGKWSGTNDTPRPPKIHLKEVGLEALWLKFLDWVVYPLISNLYPSNRLKARMNFVERHHHNDRILFGLYYEATAVYAITIKLALNDNSIDYQGGGYHFQRYNCAVKQSKKGWILTHPGYITHFHESIPVVNGTRYIMISYIY